jgi:hypothetical protein
MNDVLEVELLDRFEETYDDLELDESGGTGYLLWEGVEGLELSVWGFLQVLETDESGLIVDDDPRDDVADAVEPPDGYYYVETIFSLDLTSD